MFQILTWSGILQNTDVLPLLNRVFANDRPATIIPSVNLMPSSQKVLNRQVNTPKIKKYSEKKESSLDL